MKALIIAAGNIPSTDLIKRRAADSALLIASDNGILGFKQAGIEPDVLVGDFDSLNKCDIIEYEKNQIEIIRLKPEKNETDTEMALLVARDRGAVDISLLGATGGRLDHTVANLMLLKFAYKLSLHLIIEDDLQSIRIDKGEFIICGEEGEVISLFPVNEYAVVNAVNGLKYPLDKLTLTNSNTRGVSNVLTKNKVKIFSSDLLWIIKNK